MELLNLHELEQLARARLPQMTWDYYASGADDERCLRRNLDAFAEITLHYRVLVDVAHRDPATTVLGEPIAMPIIVAPTAFHGLAHKDGELASVRGTGDAGTIFVLSTLSNTAVERVVAAASGPVWFQLYVYKDRSATEALVRRVEAAGCRALVLTVDAPLLGRRERDVRNRFALPPDLGIENMHAAGYARLPEVAGESGIAAYFAELLDPGLTWEAIGWLRSITRLPVLVKGIVRADDAKRAIAEGAAAVVVSNHGGRQLDASPATIEVLPRIVDAVAGAGEVLIDGGVRRGSDVVKALAIGARAVLVGRPILWGLAAGGRPGVAAALAVLRRELDLAMTLCGCPDIASITRDLVDLGR
ncbi:MAG: FMN-dependent alpha-hydroxy acid dehydrogenase [Myxococcales bacterium]|nr:FMN-dependent alpha-hydroxy acid dehydrogenase [Myxococcales bacterium]